MTDDLANRVRMRSKTTMNNPLITSHAEAARADRHTVIEGDEFSTSEVHAAELEPMGYAERIDGDAAPLSDTAARLVGSQTSAGDAVQTVRAVPRTAAAKVVANPAA